MNLRYIQIFIKIYDKTPRCLFYNIYYKYNHFQKGEKMTKQISNLVVNTTSNFINKYLERFIINCIDLSR